MWDTVAAGTITAAATGLAIPGGPLHGGRRASPPQSPRSHAHAHYVPVTQEPTEPPRDAASRRKLAERLRASARARRSGAGGGGGRDLAGDACVVLERELRERDRPARHESKAREGRARATDGSWRDE